MTRESTPRFDLYAELEISRQASAEEIEAAYRLLVKRHHPDVSGSADEARIKRLNLAREWLTDPDRRQRYDASTHDWSAQPRERSFGVNARFVREFLAELHGLDRHRARQVWDGRAVAHALGYSKARRAVANLGRAERPDEWAFAREAASIIARGELGDTVLTERVLDVVADAAGAIAMRDLLPRRDYELMLLPWTWRAAPVEVNPDAPPKVVAKAPKRIAAAGIATAASAAPEVGVASGTPAAPDAPAPRTAPPTIPRAAPPALDGAAQAMAATSDGARIARPGLAAPAVLAGPAALAAPPPPSGPDTLPGSAASPEQPASPFRATPGAPVGALLDGYRPAWPSPHPEPEATLADEPPRQRRIGSPGLAAAAGIVALLAVLSGLVLSSWVPQMAVAGITDGPVQPTASAGGFLPGTASPTSAGLNSAAPPPTTNPTSGPGETQPPVPGTTLAPGATPRPGATPTARPGPTPRPTPAPSGAPTPAPTPTPTPTPAPTAAPTPALCPVPSLIGLQSNKGAADRAWANAGFTGAVTYSPDTPPHYVITSQSLPAGTSAPCTSGITVFGTP